MRIEVTQDDIDRGIRHGSTRCALARAVRRQIGEDYSVTYGALHGPGGGRMLLDGEWTAFQVRFDKTGDAIPCVIDIPDVTI